MRIMDKIINQPDYIVIIEAILSAVILGLAVTPDEVGLMIILLFTMWVLTLIIGRIMYFLLHKKSPEREVVSNNNHAFCLHDCSDVHDSVLEFLSSIKIPSFLKFPIIIMNSDPMTIMSSIILPLPWFRGKNGVKVMRGVFYHEYTHFLMGAVSVIITLVSTTTVIIYGVLKSPLVYLIFPPFLLILFSWIEETIADIHAVIKEPFYEAVMYSICLQTRKGFDIYHPPIRARVRLIRFVNKVWNGKILTSKTPPQN